MGLPMPPWSMRTYVDVILRVSSGGTETPKAIILPDGRTFEVSGLTTHSRKQSGEVLTVHIGTHTTHLYKDTTGWNGPRWYVVMRGETAPVFEGVEGEWMP